MMGVSVGVGVGGGVSVCMGVGDMVGAVSRWVWDSLLYEIINAFPSLSLFLSRLTDSSLSLHDDVTQSV